MLPIRNISYLLPMCCSFWEKYKNSPKTGLGCSTPLNLIFYWLYVIKYKLKQLNRIKCSFCIKGFARSILWRRIWILELWHDICHFRCCGTNLCGVGSISLNHKLDIITKTRQIFIQCWFYIFDTLFISFLKHGIDHSWTPCRQRRNRHIFWGDKVIFPYFFPVWNVFFFR